MIGQLLASFCFLIHLLCLQGVQYARWAPALRRFWKQGLNRVYAFWFVFVAMTIVVSTAISTDYVNWDRLNRDFVASNELSRAFLASFILVMDLMIVMQVNTKNHQAVIKMSTMEDIESGTQKNSEFHLRFGPTTPQELKECSDH